MSERPENLAPQSNIRQSNRLRILGGANDPREEIEAGNFRSLFEEEHAITDGQEDEEMEDNFAHLHPSPTKDTTPSSAKLRVHCGRRWL